ncbi:MAG: LytTR family transcriptional regulator DNA-binding domain-containing protein [Clostridiales bacterium]|nr:LytTR family transcriptional regulator DNA-binding domain-containing protein [Clostridiales bacterium]
MKILTDIDNKYQEMELHVCNNALTEEVRAVVGELHEIYDKNIAGTDEKGNKRMLRKGEILSAQAEGQKVIVLTNDGRFTVQRKLYELETDLGDIDFVRISKSEIINLRKIKYMDMSFTGTIRLVLKNGYETYVSRRNVSKIKEKLARERMEDRL